MSVVVREHLAKSRENWYTFRYTVYCGPKTCTNYGRDPDMARITRPLTNNEILKAKPREKDFTLHDGDGLFLLIKTSGKKLWRFRYQRPGSSNRTNLSLGSYPALTLAAARQIRDQHLTTLAQGMDPQQQQEQASEKRQIELDSIFSTVAANWFQIKSRSVTEDYAKDIWRSLDKDVFPAIGAIAVQEIKARTIVEALEPIKARGALETVRRLVQRINEIMIYAVNTGLIEANPASGVGMAFEKPKKQNMPTLRPEELPKLMRSLVMSNLSVPTRCLIKWQLLTLVRPSEASGARWAEIDLDAKLWTIPAERMKAKREHIVPLSSQALNILEVMKPISAHREHIFPSRNDPKQPMNSQTANAALKRIGYAGKLVAHGMRSIASTAMNETGFNSDVIESALAHIEKNEVRRAYNRALYLEQRKELMQWWGNFIKKAM
ncbi:Phage integrase, Phage P4-associated [Cronobacter malonaticus 507]|nr:Phage integrase, Phage P4-associated [Cronobacter malonaticus 507]